MHVVSQEARFNSKLVRLEVSLGLQGLRQLERFNSKLVRLEAVYGSSKALLLVSIPNWFD